MKITEITKRNVLFTVPENNEGGFVHMGLILGKRHNFIIDTGMGESNMHAIIKYIGDRKKPIVAIITHAHFDHMFGNSALKDEIIVSHMLCREIMDKEWETKSKDRMVTYRDFIDPHIHKCLPNLVFEGTMHFPDDGITLFHTPGHSDDSINVYDSVGKVLYIADNFGVADGKAYPWADKEAIKKMIAQYKELDFEICVPSHCKPVGREVIGFLEESIKEDGESQ